MGTATIDVKESALLGLNAFGERVKHLKADITSLVYHQLYGTLQQLYMQGEYTVVIKICSAINSVLL